MALAIELHFPDGFAVYNTFKKPEEPPVPRKPATVIDVLAGLAGGIDLGDSFAPSFALSKLAIPNTSLPEPRIRKTNSHDVDYRVGLVKQTMQSTSARFFISYKINETPVSFGVETRLIVGNGHGDVAETLHVVLE